MGQPDVEAVLVDQLVCGRGADRDEVLGALLARDGVIDSLEGLELAVAAEQAFGITISDDELSSAVCQSIPALAHLVRSKLTQR